MRLVKAYIISLSCLLALCNWALADGLMTPEKQAAHDKAVRQSVINEPEQKAILFFSNRLETLIISPKYEGAPEKFAWVIPVPARPVVEVEDTAIFYELVELIPKPASISPPSAATQQPVKVLERKIVGNYDVSVLSSTDGQELMKWLDGNGYSLPEKAVGPIREYVKEKWKFVACKVTDTSPETAEGLRKGELAPIKLTFRALKPVYPLRLSSANPQPFELIVLMLLPYPKVGEHVILPVKHPSGTFFPVDPWGGLAMGGLEQDRRDRCPRLSKLCRQNMALFQAVAAEGVKPEECKADIVWDVYVWKWDEEIPGSPPQKPRKSNSSWGSTWHSLPSW